MEEWGSNVSPTQSTVELHGVEGEPLPGKVRKRRRVKRKKRQQDEDVSLVANFDIPGISKIVLSTLTQRAIKCTVGEEITAENPWTRVARELIEEDLRVLEKDSQFSSLSEEIIAYNGPEFLMGYIPDSSRGYDEFYICLTESAEKTATEVLGMIEKQQQERVNNAVYKNSYPWRSRGSEKEVERLMDKNNRALLEVEVESQYPILSPVCRFRIKSVESRCDGYTEWVAGRYQFFNVYRSKIDAAVQVTPVSRANSAQTTCTYPQNACTQYEYEYKPVLKFSKEFQQNMRWFLNRHLDRIEDRIYVNSYINFYKNDYLDLVKDHKSTHQTDTSQCNEYTSFMDIIICKGLTIAAVSWHPLWTGIIAVAYSDVAQNLYTTYKPDVDEVLRAIYDVTPVLLWSFTDVLHPKLYLQTPREITALSFCPYHDNILVGGCTNGQVVIWDIKNKLENVEWEEVLTVAQQRYRTLMKLLTSWMKVTQDPSIVKCTATSDMEYSQKSPITGIQWLSAYREISKSGQLRNIPEDENRTSLQFMSIARDGTILCWDLNCEKGVSSDFARSRKLRRLKECPSALITDVSPYKVLNRVWKPVFKVNILAPGTSRNLPLSSFSMRVASTIYEEVNPNPNRKFNISERIHHKAVLVRPTHQLLNEAIAGTVEGDFLIASWEGFSFNAGEIVNKETAKLDNFAKFHDGPVVSLARSYICPELLLTVGGKVFAIWDKNFIGRPVIWRRSKHRYTHGVWNFYRPSIFRITREDGYVETWHFKTRSDRYEEIMAMSLGPLIGTFTHRLRMKKNIVGAADYNGAFRLFYLSSHLNHSREGDNEIVADICKREVEKKIILTKWQEAWKVKQAEWIQLKRLQEQKAQEEREQEIKRQKKELEVEQEQRKNEEIRLSDFYENPEPGKFREWAEKQWRIKEEQRMNKVLLQKKALDIGFLEKQQLPLRKIIADENKKKKKQQQHLNAAGKFFNNSVATLFPEVVARKPPQPPDPYGGEYSQDVKASLFEGYLNSVQQCEQFVDAHKYKYRFDWHKVIDKGRERRKYLNGLFMKRNHKQRLIVDKNENKERELSKYFAPPPVYPLELVESDLLDTISMESEEIFY